MFNNDARIQIVCNLVNNEMLVILFKTFLFEDIKLTNHDNLNI